MRRDIIDDDRAFTFVHLGHTDVVGHASGWMSPAYLDAVRAADGYVGRILDAIASAGETGETLVVVTADHGGRGRTHSDAAVYDDYRIPFLVVGPDVPAGTDLYDLNPAYRDPGTGRPTYLQKKQPIRNGAVANLATDVLGIAAVPGQPGRRSPGPRGVRTEPLSARGRSRQSASRTDAAGWATMAAWTSTTTPSGWSAKKSPTAEAPDAGRSPSCCSSSRSPGWPAGRGRRRRCSTTVRRSRSRPAPIAGPST